ncbi:hypothetical protein WDV93_20830 [Pantoea ananatis]
MRDHQQRWIAVYIPQQQNITLDISAFAATGFETGWFDPAMAS